LLCSIAETMLSVLCCCVVGAQASTSISGIQDAIYKVLSTQALYNGTELVTSRRLVRSIIHEVASSNGLITKAAENGTASSSGSSSSLSGLNETDVKILLDIVATVSSTECRALLCLNILCCGECDEANTGGANKRLILQCTCYCCKLVMHCWPISVDV
jgi:hypothetical protein